MVYSEPFDHSLFDDDDCDTPPIPPPLTPPPPSPPRPAAVASAAASCGAGFQWVTLEERKGLARSRLDVSGKGVREGYLVHLDFGAESSVSVESLIAAEIIQSERGQLLLRPRLAAGLGTIMIDVSLSSTARFPPAISCVLEGARPAAASDAWLESSYDDYLWMANEFNRQYIVSHGKTHPEYQPDVVKHDRTKLHYLNGRLWCFFGAVSNATRSLRETVRRDPTHLFAFLLLAKVHIGQGLHAEAKSALDDAMRIEPKHWQTHMLRLHVLRSLGLLDSPEAEQASLTQVSQSQVSHTSHKPKSHTSLTQASHKPHTSLTQVSHTSLAQVSHSHGFRMAHFFLCIADVSSFCRATARRAHVWRSRAARRAWRRPSS